GRSMDKSRAANWRVAVDQVLSMAAAERREAPGFTGGSVKEGVVHVQPPPKILEAMLSVRLHLDDCGDENGPLRVLPGSHRHGRLTSAEAERLEREGSAFVCRVRQGGVLLMRPLLLHASARAIRPTHRRVLHLEYASDPLPHGLRWAVTTLRPGARISRLLGLFLILAWALSGGHPAFGARME